MKQHNGLELTSVRGDCVYAIHEDEPETGRYWAIRVLPVQFPGKDYNDKTDDGVDVELAVVVTAERNDDGEWIWSRCTPNANRVFGDLIFDHTEDRRNWYYVKEHDRRRLEPED